ncbi:MAG: ferredoxin oxidoreductase [Desulfurococcaceae archaeon TW002]
MGKVIPLSGNSAVAYAVKSADVDVISAYPITPQTTIVEKLAEFIANGELDAEMIHVESEHSALSAAVGAAAAGARVYTASSSQGIALMYEIMFIASSLRLPIVMTIATRALSAPINIWNDHSDFMAVSDTGWVMMMAENNQEAHDDVILAYRIAEDPEVLLPVTTALDGYFMTHTTEPINVIEREEALSFAPKRKTWFTLNPDKPITMGALADPQWYFEFKKQQYEAMKKSREVFERSVEEFAKMFGRRYGAIEFYGDEDPEIVLVAMGHVVGNVKAYLNKRRSRDSKVGVLKVKLYRPFPEDLIVRYLRDVKIVGVIDKALVPGSSCPGPLHSEIAATLRKYEVNTKTLSFVTGLGGRPVTHEHIGMMLSKLSELKDKPISELPREPLFIGVRE